MPIIPKLEKRRNVYNTPIPRRIEYREREWDRDKDSELMPPPGSHKKDFPVPADVDQPIDPNEPTYCICHQVGIHVNIKLLNFFLSFEMNGIQIPHA